jgi:hypothetical protein
MDTTIFRSLLAINPATNFPISKNYLLSTDGLGDLLWKDVLTTLSTQDQYIGFLPSTIYTMSNFMYNISTGVLPGSLSTPNLTSTVNGLATAGYISSATFTSTITGLGTLGYLSSAFMASTIDGLGTYGYVSSATLKSTIDGLGTRYVSTQSLASTITGLGTYGYVSSATLVNTIANMGLSYVSTLSLNSTIVGLGTYGYPSSATLLSSMNVASSNLISSITDILANKQNIYLTTAGALVIAGSNINVTISTMSSFYFYDSFFNSSIHYKGKNGLQLPYNPSPTYDFYVSTLDTRLDRFSSYTHPTTSLSLEIFPNIIFPQINTNSNPQIYHVSSFLQYNASTINILQQTKFLAMNNSASNIFQQPLRLNIPGEVLKTYYNYPYLLTHRFINVSASNTNVGFDRSSNVQVFFDSTSSYYLSIQNIAT